MSAREDGAAATAPSAASGGERRRGVGPEALGDGRAPHRLVRCGRPRERRPAAGRGPTPGRRARPGAARSRRDGQGQVRRGTRLHRVFVDSDPSSPWRLRHSSGSVSDARDSVGGTAVRVATATRGGRPRDATGHGGDDAGRHEGDARLGRGPPSAGHTAGHGWTRPGVVEGTERTALRRTLEEPCTDTPSGCSSRQARAARPVLRREDAGARRRPVRRDDRDDAVPLPGLELPRPGKYKDMILDIGTEEIGHVEMLRR